MTAVYGRTDGGTDEGLDGGKAPSPLSVHREDAGLDGLGPGRRLSGLLIAP